MSVRPDPSNCPLCGSKCTNEEDGDGNGIVCCTRTEGAVPVQRNGPGGPWVQDNECPYMVYTDCHERLCLWLATLEAALKELGIRQAMSVEAMRALMEEMRKGLAVARELMREG